MSDRTVIYCLATEEAPDLNAKATTCARVCRSQGWEIVKHVRERNPERPKLAVLVAEAAAGEFERVVFFDWAAMASPDGQDLHPLVYRIHGKGVQVRLAT